jgi:para-nitrobenzyl esterase
MINTTATTTIHPSPVVDTPRGMVRGTVEDRVHVFRGIPYAEPPTGLLRFRPPAPRAPWDGIRDATRFGERHVQDFDAIESRLMYGARRPPGGPDCLNLNVWTPDLGATGLPVLVWLHGGSLKFGAGSDALYDGATFARDGVVTVTLNYRLHPAGYLWVGDRPGSGAFGLLDQIAALEWVHDAIAAFGGDPARVTVAGESAGAHSVGQLLAAPRARGLFRRAILQSGAASFDVPIEVAEVIGTEVLRRLGVPPDDTEATAAIDDASLLAASRAVEGRMIELLDARGVRPTLMARATRITSLPTWGGDVLPHRALDAVTDGAARDVDLLIGTTLDETALFPPVYPELAPELVDAAFAGTDRSAAEVMAVYRRGGLDGTDAEARVRFLTDTTFRIPAIKLAEAAGTHHPAVFLYLLTWGSPPAGRTLGAFHGLDLPFTWNKLDFVAGPLAELVGRSLSPQLADAMHGAWVEFSTSGVPQHPRLPNWPRYDVNRRATMLLDEPSRVVDDPLGEERRLWDEVRY